MWRLFKALLWLISFSLEHRHTGLPSYNSAVRGQSASPGSIAALPLAAYFLANPLSGLCSQLSLDSQKHLASIG